MTPTRLIGSKGATICLVLSLMLPLLALAAPAGLYNIDEVIYSLGAFAVAQNGNFVVETGWAEYGSDDLRLWFLVEGPDGLVPQYPPGSALAGAPVLALFGLRGLFLLNALAVAATLWLTRWLALRAYGDERIALLAPVLLIFATFLPEYAFAVWPHATSLALGLGALVLAIRASDQADRAAFAWAMASGLAVTAGMAFRVDTLLALAPIGLHVVLYAVRPVLALAGGALGMGAGLTVLASLNNAKFGTWNPLSYGYTDGGGIDLSTHYAGAAVLVAGALGLMAIRAINWTPTRRKLGGAGAAVLVIGALALVPQVRSAAIAYLNGMYALGYDITTVSEHRYGVFDVSETTRLFWGQPKKALAQSLPWIGILALLVVQPRVSGSRRWTITWLAALVAITMPFAASQWHGGLGANMRYFLPMLPFLCLFGAAAAVSLQDRVQFSSRNLFLLLAAGGALAAIVGSMGLAEALAMNQVLTRYVFIVLALLTLGAAIWGAKIAWFPAAAMAGFTVAVGMAAYIGPIQDTMLMLDRRGQSEATRAAVADLDEPAVFHGPPEFLLNFGGAPRHLVGIMGRLDQTIDQDLLARALDDGRRVFIWQDYASRVVADSDGRFRAARTQVFGPSAMTEITVGPQKTARAAE